MIRRLFLVILLFHVVLWARRVKADDTHGVCSSRVIPLPKVFGAVVTAFSAAVVENYTDPTNSVTGLDFCQVNITLTHPGWNDSVANQVWLPLTGWNERFVGSGGGGFSAGFWSSLGPLVQQGYCAVSTDAGHSASIQTALSADAWALESKGNINWPALVDFGSRSVHEMTVIGKAIATSFYGRSAKYSYWNGCSTGGRQGYMEAQMYPDDYNGILANAPAVQWNSFTPAQQWPYVVMNNEHYAPRGCEFDFVNERLIAACDGLDGVRDGVVGAPGLCKFNPYSIVGQSFYCAADNTTSTFTAAAATVVEKIWEGPKTLNSTSLWYGILPSTNFSSLAPTQTFSNGTTIPLPFGISDSWYRNYLFKQVDYNTADLTYAEFPITFHQSHQQYDSVIGTMDPDLSAFKARGAKLLTWQGLADNLIMPNGTMEYYDRVHTLFPDVSDFYRVFFAPGVGHCGGGPGPLPTNPLMALRNWVENGVAPSFLEAQSQHAINGTIVHRSLCQYPQVSRYIGGDITKATSYICASSF